jgi:CBS domain containing-hemolysin-like protein
MEEPMFVHMTRDISSILPEMKEKNCEMAIVLDEFGGMLGIITAEDIVEEIVGDIYDEGDDVEDDVIRRGDVFELDGGMTIHDFFDEFELSDADFESEYTTLGGLASEILDKIPEEGDSFEFMGYNMVVKETASNRVEKIEATKIPEPEEEKGE